MAFSEIESPSNLDNFAVVVVAALDIVETVARERDFDRALHDLKVVTCKLDTRLH